MKLLPVILIDLEQISPQPDFVNMLICISNQHVLSQIGHTLEKHARSSGTVKLGVFLIESIHVLLLFLSVLSTRWAPNQLREF